MKSRSLLIVVLSLFMTIAAGSFEIPASATPATSRAAHVPEARVADVANGDTREWAPAQVQATVEAILIDSYRAAGLRVDDASALAAQPKDGDPNTVFVGLRNSSAPPSILVATHDGYRLEVFNPRDFGRVTDDRFPSTGYSYNLSASGSVLAKEPSTWAFKSASAVPSDGTVPKPAEQINTQHKNRTAVFAQIFYYHCDFGAGGPYHDVGLIGDIIVSQTFIFCNWPGSASQNATLWELFVGIWNHNYQYQLLTYSPYGFWESFDSTWSAAFYTPFGDHVYGTTCGSCAGFLNGAVWIGPITVDSDLVGMPWVAYEY